MPSQESNEELIIVGIGASAGGFEALQQFVQNIQEQSQLSYIIAQHLDPNHPTMLVKLLSRSCKIPISEAEDGKPVEANQIYICPPGKNITIQEGNLIKLTDTRTRIYPKPSINIFFTSLAKQLETKAVGIILSGSGSDGVEGISAIKDAGGFTMVQTEKSAKYPSMPRAAIDTGCVDLVLEPFQMARDLPKIINTPQALEEAKELPKNIDRVFDLLLEETEIDFSDYKLSTVHRRLERRMSANRVHNIHDYVDVLVKSSQEISLLCKDLLVIVTSFFRDKEAFEALKEQIESTIISKKERSLYKVWVPGCATGEEAYSIAIILNEIFTEKGLNLKLQIFATDISDDAIEKARRASYTREDILHLEESIITRYFTKRDGLYTLNKTLRDAIIFSKHDIIKDPPFLKVDLISCRNLLIYFNNTLQERIFNIFAYSLNEQGLLFLGKSENTSLLEAQFMTLDSKWKIFKRTSDVTTTNINSFNYYPKRYLNKGYEALISSPAKKLNKKEIIDDLIQENIKTLSENIIILDHKNAMVYSHGDIEQYIQFPKGVFSNDIFELIDDRFRLTVRTLLSKSKRETTTIMQKVPVDIFNEEVTKAVNVIALPITVGTMEGGTALLFIDGMDNFNPLRDEPTLVHTTNTKELEYELTQTKERLQTVIEELETSNEELQSTNEELQSSNEELQSVNEELQTSNEELQSSNEELSTVNDELGAKSLELKHTSQDLVNMFDSLEFASVLLDKQLRIKRYTPQMKQIFDIQITDINHVITTVECYLDIPNLRKHLLGAMQQGTQYQNEIEYEGHYYHMNITPNKDENSEVYGAILSFYDKTALHQKELQLIETQKVIKERKERLKKILDGTDNILVLQNKTCEIIYINQQFFKFFTEYKNIEAFKKEHTSLFELFDNEGETDINKSFFKRNIPQKLGESLQHQVKIKRDNRTYHFRVTFSPVNLELGHEEFVVTLSNITELEEEMAKNIKQERLLQQQAKMASMGEMIGNIAHQWRQPLNALSTLNTLLRLEYEEEGHLSKKQIEEYQEQANYFIQKMSTTIDDFRNFFLPSHKKRVAFNLKESIEQMATFLKESYDLHQIKLIVNVDEKIELNSYQNEFEQVLLNILNNAKDAHIINTTEKPMVTINFCDEQERICLSIQDNAGGIDEKIIDKVFEPYFSTKFEDEGTGIGLYMSKMIIEQSMDGKLSIENIDEGVVVTIYLPKEEK
jgi:two-component system CheB/CheR fusion protein